MPVLLEEPHPYRVLYDVVDMAENKHTNPNYVENGGIIHPVFLEILQNVKNDEKFKNDAKGMANVLQYIWHINKLDMVRCYTCQIFKDY